MNRSVLIGIFLVLLVLSIATVSAIVVSGFTGGGNVVPPEEVSCGDARAILRIINEDFGEELKALLPEQESRVLLTVNETSGTWTLLREKDGILCWIGNGVQAMTER